MKKQVKVNFTELELDVLWTAMSQRILEVITEETPWSEKQGVYDFYYELREKIDLARK